MNAVAGNRYSTTSIVLHWLVAALVLCSISLGLYMVGLQLSPMKLKLYSWHKWIGVTIFLLAVLRVVWRLTRPAPALPRGMPLWQRRVAAASHVLLYVLLFAIPLSGWVMSSASGVQVVYLGVLPLPDLVVKDKGLAEQLKTLHEALGWALMTLLILHITAAIKHHWVDRDEVLHRMLPIVNSRTSR